MKVHPHLFDALAAAIDRVGAARQAVDRGACLASVGEAMLWTMLIDDRLQDSGGGYRESRDSNPEGQWLPGLRYAWNSLKHANLDEIVDINNGLKFPLSWPLTFREVCWKPVAEMPGPKQFNAKQKAAYESHLQSQPVQLILWGVTNFLKRTAAAALSQQ